MIIIIVIILAVMLHKVLVRQTAINTPSESIERTAERMNLLLSTNSSIGKIELCSCNGFFYVGFDVETFLAGLEEVGLDITVFKFTNLRDAVNDFMKIREYFLPLDFSNRQILRRETMRRLLES